MFVYYSRQKKRKGAAFNSQDERMYLKESLDKQKCPSCLAAIQQFLKTDNGTKGDFNKCITKKKI